MIQAAKIIGTRLATTGLIGAGRSHSYMQTKLNYHLDLSSVILICRDIMFFLIGVTFILLFILTGITPLLNIGLALLHHNVVYFILTFKISTTIRNNPTFFLLVCGILFVLSLDLGFELAYLYINGPNWGTDTSNSGGSNSNNSNMPNGGANNSTFAHHKPNDGSDDYKDCLPQTSESSEAELLKKQKMLTNKRSNFVGYYKLLCGMDPSSDRYSQLWHSRERDFLRLLRLEMELEAHPNGKGKGNIPEMAGISKREMEQAQAAEFQTPLHTKSWLRLKETERLIDEYAKEQLYK